MHQQSLADCSYCCSAGSISNGYCMICDEAVPGRSLHPDGQPPALAAASLGRPEPAAASSRPVHAQSELAMIDWRPTR